MRQQAITQLSSGKKYTVLEDYIYNKGLKFNLVILVQGDTQLGKSTVVQYLLDCLSLRKFKHLWDYKKYCARSFEEFLAMVSKYNNALIVYEEASKDVSIDSYWSDLNHFFNVVLQTQGYKHNTYVLVMPSSLGISKRQRRYIKLGLEVIQRIEEPGLHASVIRPTIYKRTYWKLDTEKLSYKFLPISFIIYSPKDLARSKEYTAWLEGMKVDTMRNINREFKRSKRKAIVKKRRDFERLRKATSWY
jgi:hypothetical protein